MFERFTDRCRKVMLFANQEAQRLNHEYIGTEHILLGFVREGSGTGAFVLKNLDIDLRQVRVEVERLVKPGPDMVTMGGLPQTPRAKKAIEYAIEEARNLDHTYVGTEHLILGLIREHDGTAAQVLMNMGLRIEDVRQEILNVLGAAPEESPELQNALNEHPLIRSLDRLIVAARAEMAGTQRSVARARAKQLRDRLAALQQRRERLLLALAANPELAELHEDPIIQTFLPMPECPHTTVRPKFVADIEARVRRFDRIVLVGEPGCGRRSMISQIAARLIEVGVLEGLSCELRMPDVVSLSQLSEPHAALDILERYLGKHIKSGVCGVVLPDLDLLLAGVSEPLCDAFKHFLLLAIESRGVVIATTTHRGAETIRVRWPGLAQRLNFVPVPPPEGALLAREVERVLQKSTDSGATVERGVVEEVLRVSRAQDRTEPGGSLHLVQAAIDLCVRRRGAGNPGTLSSIGEPRLVAVQHELTDAMASGDTERFRLAAKKMEDLMRKVAQSPRARPQKLSLLIEVADVELAAKEIWS